MARRAISTRQYTIEQAHRESEQAARAIAARINDERSLATARLQPVFNSGWWETARPQDVSDMWAEANSWQDPDRPATSPTIFDHAAGRIRQELHDRTGLDPTQMIALAAVQDLERAHEVTLAQPLSQPAEAEVTGPDLTASRGFDDPRRREQLRTRLVAAGVPEPAIQARTLADLGQARAATEAAQTPVAAAAEPQLRASRSASHD
ncbi:MAG: hypothetical protein ACRDK8_12860, partial [Solirubrobacteraceae bacterium]